MTPRGEAIKERILRAAEQEMQRIADDLLAAAQRDISASPPPDEDPNEAVKLRESGRVEGPRRWGGRFGTGVSVTVGFHTEYAAVQHEGKWSYAREGVKGKAAGGRVFIEVKHHPGGGSTKFLERNVKARTISELPQRLAEAIRVELARTR